jgi:hypothetical protein
MGQIIEEYGISLILLIVGGAVLGTLGLIISYL